MKTAFVLSGGGAKGCFQLGAMQALDDMGIRPDVLYGTSVGALNAAGYSYGGLTTLQAVWRSIKSRRDILSIDWWGLLTMTASGLYSMRPLRKKIKKLVKGSPKTDAWVCSVDLQDGTVVYTRSGSSNFAQQVEASAAIPVAMKPVAGGYVDGGVREQSPLRKAIDDGCDRIYAILCNPVKQHLNHFKIPRWPLPLIPIGLRAIEIMEHEVFLNDIRRCIEHNDLIKDGNGVPGRRHIELHIIAPPELVITTLEFDAAKIARGVQQGYDITRQQLKDN